MGGASNRIVRLKSFLSSCIIGLQVDERIERGGSLPHNKAYNEVPPKYGFVYQFILITGKG